MNLGLTLSVFSVMLSVLVPTASAQSSPLLISPSSVVFCGKPGELLSPAPVSISTPTASATFVTSSVTSDGNWLTADPLFNTVTTFPHPQLVLGFNSAFIPFATGTYMGQVVLGTFDGAKLATIPVLLQVSNAGCGTMNTGSLYADSGPFTIQLPPGATASNLVNIYNTYPTNVTIVPNATTSAGQNWISVIQSNLTVVTGPLYPTPLNVDISSQGLGPGTYTGTIELAASNAISLYVPITLIVNAAAGDARLVASPSPLPLTIPAGTVSTSAEIKITNLNSSAVSIAASVTSDKPWLSVAPASAVIQPKSTISIAANFAGASLSPGQNKGAVHVQVTSGNAGSLEIPVSAVYGIATELSYQGSVNFTTASGGAGPISQSIAVSTSAGVSYPVSFSTTAFSSVYQPWLSVTPFNEIASPGAPGTLTVTVQPALLPPGPAIGSITLKPVDSSAPVTIPVNVNAGIDSSLSVAPTQLSFAYQAGATLPLPQSVLLTTTLPSNYSVQASTAGGGNWLSVNTGSAGAIRTPATITAQVNPSGLAPGTYSGQISIVNIESGKQQIVPVTLTIGPPLAISATPAALAFHYQAGGPSIPAVQSVQLASTGGVASFAATASGLNGAPNFLIVSVSGSSTPAMLTVGVDAAVLATLPPGQYSAAVSISSPGLPSGSPIIPVMLVITPVAPQPQSVLSSASSQPSPVAPGELVTVFGLNLGPLEGVPFSLTSQGSVPAQLGGTTVLFDGIPAPLLYAGAGQINAIVPYEIAGRTQVNLVVTRNGAASLPFALAVADTVPAIFSANQSGQGPGSILNADGSPNTSTNPASKRSVIQIFGTGEGGFPGAVTGSVTPATAPFELFHAPVSVSIGGQPAEIQFIGEAPGLISGVFQVNAVVPLNAGSGAQPVLLSVGNNNNGAQGITVFVE